MNRFLPAKRVSHGQAPVSAPATMGTSNHTFDCPTCDALTEAAAEWRQWTCRECGTVYGCAVCPHCAGVMQMPSWGKGKWRCPHCEGTIRPAALGTWTTVGMFDADSRRNVTAQHLVHESSGFL